MRLGIDLKDLYFIDFSNFKKEFPEVFALPKEIQLLRWENANKNKKKMIQEIIDEREKIIQNNESLEFSQIDCKSATNSHFYFNRRFNQINRINLSSSNQDLRNKSTISKKNSRTLTNLNYSNAFMNNSSKKTSLFEDELKLVEKIKARHRLEAHNLIEFEIKQQILRKEHEIMQHKDKEVIEYEKRYAIRRKKLGDLEERKSDLLKSKDDINKKLQKDFNTEKKKEEISNNSQGKNIQNKSESEKNNLEEINGKEKDQSQTEEKSIIQKEDLSDINNEQKITANDNLKEFPTFIYAGVTKEEALEYIEESVKQINDEINRLHQEEIAENVKRSKFSKRDAENKRKIEEFQINCEKIYEEERRKASERKQFMELKEKDRLENLEKKRIQRVKDNEKHKKMHQIRFDNTQSKFEEKMKNQSELFTRKLIMSEEKRNQLEELRSIALKKKELLHLQKLDEIQRFFQKNKELEMIRSFEFQRKMEDIDRNKQMVDKNREDEIKIRTLDLKMKSHNSLQSRIKLGKEEEKKNEFVVYRINNFYYKSQKKKEESEREHMFKNESNTLKRNVVEQKIRRIEKVKEVQRLLEKEKIEEVSKKFANFHNQKLLSLNKKRLLAIEIANQRKNTLDKFDDFMNRNKDITPDMLKELFPYDYELLDKFKIYHEGSQMNKTIYRSTSHVCNASLKKHNDKSQFDVSKYKSNTSFRSFNMASGKSKIASNTRGFSMTNYSNFNFNPLNRTSFSKLKLEPLNEKNVIKSKDFSQEEIDYFKNNLDNYNDFNRNNCEIDMQKPNKKEMIPENLNKINIGKSNIIDSSINNNYCNYINYNNSKSAFLNNKKNNQFVCLKSSCNLTGKNWHKLSESMPIISNNLDINNPKYKNDNYYNAINNNGNNNICYNSSSVNEDKNKKKLIEKDIEKKLESFKVKLNAKMLGILKEEKQKEEERESLYNKANNEVEKKRLENIINLERVQSSERIIKINEENEKKLKEFEAKLKPKLKEVSY